MESFKNYISEKDKEPKNYVIKMDAEENYFLHQGKMKLPKALKLFRVK